MVFKTLLGGLLLLMLSHIIDAHFYRICYYSGWALYRDKETALTPENIDPHLCTHIVFAFATIDDTGTNLKATDGYQELDLHRRLYALRAHNKNIKFMLSVGGWDLESGLFSKLVSSEDNMQKFATNTIAFLRGRTRDFDGLDIDWQYPGARGSPRGDVERFYKFLRLLKWEFEHEEHPDIKAPLFLSISVNAIPEEANMYYDLKRYARFVDWINFKMYDFHGHWEDPMYARHHSPLTSKIDPRNVNELSRYWIGKGIPLQQFVLGLPFFGRSYTLANARNATPDAPTIGSGADNGNGYPVSHLCHFVKNGAEEKIIRDEGVPYLNIGTEWIGYDNTDSIRAKAELAFNNHLLGVSVWSLDMDDWNATCGTQYPMMHAVLEGLMATHEYHEGVLAGKQEKFQVDKALKEIKRQRNVIWKSQDKAYAKAHGIAHV